MFSAFPKRAVKIVKAKDLKFKRVSPVRNNFVIVRVKSYLKPSDCPEEYVEYSYNLKSSDNHINYEEGL